VTFDSNACTAANCVGGAIFDGHLMNLQDSTLTNNTSAGYAGAIFADGDAALTRVTLQNNQCLAAATCHGGALHAVGSLTLTDSNIYSNTSTSYGGAISVDSGGLFVQGGRFAYNAAPGGTGGAVSTGVGPNQINGAYFANNTADAGSAIATGFGLGASTTTISSTQFFDNVGGSAGAVEAVFNNTSLRVVNSLFDGNTTSLTGQGAGVYVNSYLGHATLLYDTFAGILLNPGQAVAVVSATAGISDSIFFRYSVAISVATTSASADYNLFFENGLNKFGSVSGGAHDVNADPLFVNAPQDDYHLSAGSPAIDASADVGVYTDFEGDPRPFGAADIGFDERVVLRYLYLPLVRR
jgi:hypothetical protein